MCKDQPDFKPLGLKFYGLWGWFAASLCHEFHFEIQYTVVSFEASCWCKKEMRPYWEVRLKYISLIMEKVSSCCLAIFHTSVLALPGCSIVVEHLSVSLTSLRISKGQELGQANRKYSLLNKQVNIGSNGIKSPPQISLGIYWWEDSI